jgi:hypothetical protein
VNIWGSKWVAVPSSYSIQSPQSLLSHDAKVEELINCNTFGWNQNLLKELFWPEEVKAILYIPLSNTNQPNWLIWRGTMNGEFSVRSAYHLWKEFTDQSSAKGSGRDEESKIWPVMWKLRS